MTGWEDLCPDEAEPNPAIWSRYLESLFTRYSEMRKQQDDAFAAEYDRASLKIRTCSTSKKS